MNLRITQLAALLALVISQIALGDEPDYDSPEDALRHDMLILDADVRDSALAGYKRRFNLSDDEFSEHLVKLATIATNSEEATLRMFTVAALGDFGTTNALTFLRNEALNGWASGGISGYGLITGFDHRFFSLAEQMLADSSNKNWGRRDPVYRVFETILCSSSCRGTTITETAKSKARKALKNHAFSDSYHRVLIDMILAENDFGEPPYKNSPDRLRIARVACDDPDSSVYARGYFSGVLEQMKREAAATNAFSNKKTKNEHEHKPTPILGSNAGQSANDEEMPVANEKAQYWRIILSLLAILVAVLSVVVGVRRKRNIRKSMVSQHGDGGICSACK